MGCFIIRGYKSGRRNMGLGGHKRGLPSLRARENAAEVKLALKRLDVSEKAKDQEVWGS